MTKRTPGFGDVGDWVSNNGDERSAHLSGSIAPMRSNQLNMSAAFVVMARTTSSVASHLRAKSETFIGRLAHEFFPDRTSPCQTQRQTSLRLQNPLNQTCIVTFGGLIGKISLPTSNAAQNPAALRLKIRPV